MSRRFAVLLTADVVDYSLMMGEDEDAAIAAVRSLRDETLEPVVHQHEGEVLKRMGDGWIFAFSSVAAAISAAKDAQTNLAAERSLRLRMGVHMGDIVEDDVDIYGAGVNLAARLLTEAPPGGLMISDDVHRQLSDRQAASFTDAGTFNFKNISRPVQGFQWRPEAPSSDVRSGDVPTIALEAFSATPKEDEIADAAADLRDELIHGLSRRTGIRVLDAAEARADAATYLLRGRVRHTSGVARASFSMVLRSDGSSRWR